MSMNTNVVGFKPTDETWEKMKAVWVACEKASLEIPKDVGEFFDWNDPKEMSGMKVSIEGTDAVSPWSSEMQEGYEVDIRKLPKGVNIVRFYNSF